jgi:hypothetical protein
MLYDGGNTRIVPFGTSVSNSTDSECSTDVLAGGEDGENESVRTLIDVGVEFTCESDVDPICNVGDTFCGSDLATSIASALDEVSVNFPDSVTELLLELKLGAAVTKGSNSDWWVLLA